MHGNFIPYACSWFCAHVGRIWPQSLSQFALVSFDRHVGLLIVWRQAIPPTSCALSLSFSLSLSLSRSIILLISLFFTEIYLSVNADNIFAPSKVYSIINESTTFYCDAVGVNAFWQINESTVQDEGDIQWTDKGFIFEPNVKFNLVDNNRHIYHNTLSVPSQKELNSTIIGCFTINQQHQPVLSDEIEIIVMGEYAVCM